MGNSTKNVVIIIPVFKKALSRTEILSLENCISVLGEFPIALVAPYDLNIEYYIEIFAGRAFTVERFENLFFTNIGGYNKLMLNPKFYKRFLPYRFLLIHQLDAFIFKNELDYWCSLNYDYIGAPTPPHFNKSNEIQFLAGYSRFLTILNRVFGSELRVSNVGNGGLSLRKTKSCYWLLFFLKSRIQKWGSNNEDGFFKYWGNILNPLFRLPPDSLAYRFSIETEPSKNLGRLNGALPFGCHAFERYEPKKWKTFIDF